MFQFEDFSIKYNRYFQSRKIWLDTAVTMFSTAYFSVLDWRILILVDVDFVTLVLMNIYRLVVDDYCVREVEFLLASKVSFSSTMSSGMEILKHNVPRVVFLCSYSGVRCKNDEV